MPTLNQERTAHKVKEVIESGKTMDGKDILAFVGYGKGIQKNAGVVFNSKGFKVAVDTNNYAFHLGQGYSTLLEDNFKSYEFIK